MFPSFHQERLFIQPDILLGDNLEPPLSPRTGDSYTIFPAGHDDSSDNTLRPGTPDDSAYTEDDIAVSSWPSRQVDYLSHEWSEEDIWSSWRYIVTRRDKVPNSARLENASWRTWMKTKNNLGTISPESLNWHKDCDVTWLYGPLQLGVKILYSTQIEPSSVSLSKNDSLVNLDKKPILKKRSMSEVMLQRSLSNASLLKQAIAAIQTEGTSGILRLHPEPATMNNFAPPFLRGMGGRSTSLTPSTGSTAITSPSVERKHIHFNEHVEQCIAVDVNGDNDEEKDVDSDRYDSNSDPDIGFMMKRIKIKKRAPLASKRTIAKTMSADGKTIAMLPSTTLKYGEDTPEPRETAMKHSRSRLMSLASSQEALRPTTQPVKFFLGEEDILDDAILSPHSGCASPPAEGAGIGLHRSASSSGVCDEPAGMRRTPSGMFMPYDENDLTPGDGIFAQLIDTINTARDIAHVIWNAGRRE